MKKFIIIVCALMVLLTGCADEKTFKKADGTEFTAEPYGWMNKGKAIEGVQYEVCAGNLVWSIVLGETVIAPVLVTGLALWEPVNYVEPTE